MMESKYYKYIVAIILVAPVVVNIIRYCTNPIPWLIPIVGKSSDWIGFWGSYAGAIIGGLITLLVLHYTIKENSKVRDIQVKTIKYTQQQTWLENLRKQLIENYRMFDMQTISIAIFNMQNKAYDHALSILLSLNRNVEFQAHSSSLYFITEDLAPEEDNYNKVVTLIMSEYGTLINDLMFFCPILQTQSSEHPMPPDIIIAIAKQTYAQTLSSSKASPIFQKYYERHSVLPQIARLNKDDNFIDNLYCIMNEVIKNSLQVHCRKYELIACTEEVLQYETRRINQIIE